MMVPEFEEVAYSCELDQVAGPVKTQYGYHIIKVLERTEKSILTLEEVGDKVREKLLSDKQQVIYEDKLNELKEKYNVHTEKIED